MKRWSNDIVSFRITLESAHRSPSQSGRSVHIHEYIWHMPS